MTFRFFLCAPLLALSACVTPVGPVEVTRFFDAEALQAMARGEVAVRLGENYGPPIDEEEVYAAAVASELERLGFTIVPADQPVLVATVRVERDVLQPVRDGGPVSVGVGGSTGSYGSGVGVGIGIDLSGPPPELVSTRLSVTLQGVSDKLAIWEGRAQYDVRADAPSAEAQLNAAKMASALFSDFPGSNGETIEVE